MNADLSTHVKDSITVNFHTTDCSSVQILDNYLKYGFLIKLKIQDPHGFMLEMGVYGCLAANIGLLVFCMTSYMI